VNISDAISLHLEESARVKQLVNKHCRSEIEQAVLLLSSALDQGNKILFCGNGGSAADAQHLAAEFVIRLSHDFERPALPAIALTTDTSILTAGSNDLGYEQVFARQVEALGAKGDVLIGITTSGNSDNIIRALTKGKEKGMHTIALLGNDGGRCKNLADISIIVPSVNTQYIQEAHIAIGHILVELTEQKLFGN
jgi:D-sedoheptulose 7-phosphate isomerase